MADAHGSGPCVRKDVGVQLPPCPPNHWDSPQGPFGSPNTFPPWIPWPSTPWQDSPPNPTLTPDVGATMTNLANVDHFFVKQKITMMVNRYEIRAALPDGSEGEVLAVAQQKRLAFKEQVTFFADEERQRAGVLLQGAQEAGPRRRVRHHRRAGNAAGHVPQGVHEVAAPVLVGGHLEGAGFSRGRPSATRASRCTAPVGVAALRRGTAVAVRVPLRLHRAQGKVVLSSARKRSLRDRYEVTVPGGQVDGRWRRQWRSRWTRCRADEPARSVSQSRSGRAALNCSWTS